MADLCSQHARDLVKLFLYLHGTEMYSHIGSALNYACTEVTKIKVLPRKFSSHKYLIQISNLYCTTGFEPVGKTIVSAVVARPELQRIIKTFSPLSPSNKILSIEIFRTNFGSLNIRETYLIDRLGGIDSCCENITQAALSTGNVEIRLTFSHVLSESNLQEIENFLHAGAWLLPSSSSISSLVCVKTPNIDKLVLPRRKVSTPSECFSQYSRYLCNLINLPLLASNTAVEEGMMIGVLIFQRSEPGKESIKTSINEVFPLQILLSRNGIPIRESDLVLDEQSFLAHHALKDSWKCLSYMLGLKYMHTCEQVGSKLPFFLTVGGFKNHLDNNLAKVVVVMDYDQKSLTAKFQGVYAAVRKTLKEIQATHKIFPTGGRSQRYLVEDVYLPEATKACNSIISRANRLVQLKLLEVIQNIYGEKLIHDQRTIEYFTMKRFQELFQQNTSNYSWEDT